MNKRKTMINQCRRKLSELINLSINHEPPLHKFVSYYTANDYYYSMTEWLSNRHFRVVFCLCVKTSLLAKTFIWKCVLPTVSFSCKSLTNFHNNGFTRKLVLKQRNKITREWPIGLTREWVGSWLGAEVSGNRIWVRAWFCEWSYGMIRWLAVQSNH